MTDHEQKSTIRDLFKWWWKKKDTGAPDGSSQTLQEADRFGQSKHSSAKKVAKAPVVLISVTHREEETVFPEKVTANETLNRKTKSYQRHESEGSKESFNKRLSSFVVRNESGFPSRSISLQNLPNKIPEEESKEEKKTNLSKVLGRLATSLGSLSRIGRGRKAKHSSDRVTTSEESTHGSKHNEWSVRCPVRHNCHLDLHEHTLDFHDTDLISSPLAFSSPKYIRVFGKTKISPPHIDNSPSCSNQKYFGDFSLSKTAPSAFHRGKHGNIVTRGGKITKLSHSPNHSPIQKSNTKVDEKNKSHTITGESNSDGATKEIALGIHCSRLSVTDQSTATVVSTKRPDVLITSHHDNNSYDAENDDDDVFLPCTNSALTRHRQQLIPSVRVALRDETYSVNISETNLNFLSDSSSSPRSSVSSCEATNHHLTIDTFFQRQLSSTSDITDVTSMTSSSSLTPRRLYQDNELVSDDSAPCSSSVDGVSEQEFADFHQCPYIAKQTEYLSNEQTNEQLLRHGAAVFKQPSFGELEKDFEDFVNKYNAKKILNKSKTTH